MTLQPATALPVGAAMLAVAMAGGGFGPIALGVCTAAIWLLIAGLGVGGRLSFAGLTTPLALVLGLLALIAAWTALSLSWAGDDGAAFVDLARGLLYLGLVTLVGLTARPGDAASWIAGVAVGGTAIAVVAVASRSLGFGADAELAEVLPRAAERLSYPLGYWNALGYLAAMTLPALAWITVGARGAAPRLAAAGSVPVVLALFLTSSRGALLAALLGLVALAACTRDRGPLLRSGLAVAPAWLLVVVIAAVRRAELDAAAGVSAWGVVVAGATVAAAALACALHRRLQRGDAGVPVAVVRLTPLRAAAILVLVGVLVAAIGPSSFVGEFRTQGTADPSQATDALVSGSGRSSFWRVATEAFADDPLRGVGAGNYPYYWNLNGDLPVPVANAHSAPLEAFAELGLVGGLALIGLLASALAAAWRLLRGPTPSLPGSRALIGAAVGTGVAGLVGISIDWTWQLPAAASPLLIAVALLCGQALRSPGSAGSVLVDARVPGYERFDGPRRAPRGVLGAGLGLGALASVWVGVVLTAASVQLERSADRLERGDLQGAAEAARAASRIEPWSPEPSLRLSEIEQAATNYQAARRRAEETIRLSPDDFRPWLLLFEAQGALGNEGPSVAYLLRAIELGPEILSANDIRQGLR